MKLQQLEYAVTAARLGNFTKAANSLFVSQPTLSQQISLLEKELGIDLFFRHAKSVSLTPAGENFLIYAERILNDVKILKEEVDNHKNLHKGSIKIGVPFIFGYLGLSKKLKKILKKYDSIAASLIVGGSKSLYEQLLKGAIDLAIVTGARQETHYKDITLIRLAQCNLKAAVPVHSALSHKKELTFEDLKDQTIQLPPSSSAFRIELDALIHKYNIKNILTSEGAGGSELSIKMAAEGYGIAFCSEWVAKCHPDCGCVFIPLYPPIPRYLYLAVLERTTDYPTHKAIVDAILAYYKSERAAGK